jgi:hypothetical protein
MAAPDEMYEAHSQEPAMRQLYPWCLRLLDDGHSDIRLPGDPLPLRADLQHGVLQP